MKNSDALEGQRTSILPSKHLSEALSVTIMGIDLASFLVVAKAKDAQTKMKK